MRDGELNVKGPRIVDADTSTARCFSAAQRPDSHGRNSVRLGQCGACNVMSARMGPIRASPDHRARERQHHHVEGLGTREESSHAAAGFMDEQAAPSVTLPGMIMRAQALRYNVRAPQTGGHQRPHAANLAAERATHMRILRAVAPRAVDEMKSRRCPDATRSPADDRHAHRAGTQSRRARNGARRRADRSFSLPRAALSGRRKRRTRVASRASAALAGSSGQSAARPGFGSMRTGNHRVHGKAELGRGSRPRCSQIADAEELKVDTHVINMITADNGENPQRGSTPAAIQCGQRQLPFSMPRQARENPYQFAPAASASAST